MEHASALRSDLEELESLLKIAKRPANIRVLIQLIGLLGIKLRHSVYVHLEGLAELTPDATCVRFEENSAELVVRNLRGRNYILKFNPLYAPIDTQKSNFSVKRDTATIRLAKGDSEMKRTIAKAWTESQERKLKGIQAEDGLF
ncbi:calcyclin binding protein, putative [Eimeria acervulina]|uniref:Calcyclin binding protein, putative n=1 Tax=Eimeria acervulina TaxID=5801 RepID=U6G811_EIMAC|nr:calcyclin binding protein, putative [Eimeria acervulina]CDI76320.1 calcyclin binding protein, putative [Eimeria acervulina]